MTETERPRPRPNPESQPYWDSVAAHAMRLQRCARCAAFRFYPTPVCPVCWSAEFSWEPVSGAATLHSYTVVERPVTEAFAAEVPYVVALVTLAEGPTMMVNLEGVPHEAIEIGMPLALGYSDFDGFTLPTAGPAA